MRYIIIILLITSCTTQKQIDDTEHLWIGDDGIEFYD